MTDKIVKPLSKKGRTSTDQGIGVVDADQAAAMEEAARTSLPDGAYDKALRIALGNAE